MRMSIWDKQWFNFWPKEDRIEVGHTVEADLPDRTLVVKRTGFKTWESWTVFYDKDENPIIRDHEEWPDEDDAFYDIDQADYNGLL